MKLKFFHKVWDIILRIKHREKCKFAVDVFSDPPFGHFRAKIHIFVYFP